MTKWTEIGGKDIDLDKVTHYETNSMFGGTDVTFIGGSMTHILMETPEFRKLMRGESALLPPIVNNTINIAPENTGPKTLNFHTVDNVETAQRVLNKLKIVGQCTYFDNMEAVKAFDFSNAGTEFFMERTLSPAEVKAHLSDYKVLIHYRT